MEYKYIIMITVTGVLLSCNIQKSSNTHSHDASSNHYHDSTGAEKQLDDYFGNYTLSDDDFGTKTSVTLKGDNRIMITNSLPNHKTGEYPRKGNPNTISAQNKTYSFPINPEFTGTPNWVREPGIAINGVKFEPGTAEVVECDTGENYRVEAFQDLINLGLDFNHAHVQPTGAYHYHGTPTSVIENIDNGKDLVHVGFAHDGFPMYYSQSGAYKPSYKLVDGDRSGEDCTYSNPKNTIDVSIDGHHDGTYTSDFEFVDGSGDLDACNGITIDGRYMYLVTSEFPYVSRCLMGEYVQPERKGSRPNQEKERTGRPSIAQVFEHMDINKDEKLTKAELKGPIANDFSRIDSNEDGYITKEELENARKDES